MAARGWKLAWNTPSQSENSSAILDLIVNRDLTVKRNIHGNFFPNWQNYIPTIRGYQTAAGNSTLATNILYTATGRWLKLSTTVIFQAIIQIASPRSQNWVSNLYVDLPTKTNLQFSASTVYHITGDTADHTWYPLFGIARAGGNQIVIIPAQTAPGAILLMYSIIPPYEVTVSGSYELTL